MPRKSRKNVGLIGLGIIGARVATGLRAAGFQVFVWNRSAKPAPNFLGSPAEIAESCEIIQIFVADAPALFDVIEAMGDALTSQHVIVCNSTVGPEAVLEAAKLVMDRGAQFLDAPFTGSKSAAEKRQLVYYIGGDEAPYLRAKPVLEATSKAIVRIGAIGHASTVKVVTNMISAVTIQTLAEALAIVQKAGLDPEVLGLAIAHNGCRSGVIELKLPKMVAGDYDPHFSLKNMFKDVQLGIHLANALNIEIPATTVTAGVLYGAINQGWADLDFAALYKIYAPLARPAVMPAQEKREPSPIQPLAAPLITSTPPPTTSTPKPVGGDLSKPVGADPLPAKTPAPASLLPAALMPAPPAESKAPSDLRNETKAVRIDPSLLDTPGKGAGEKGEETKELEAVIAEFRDVPSAEEDADSAPGSPQDHPNSSGVIAPGNGESAASAPKPARRVNFVRRWFVSRTRGSN